MRTPFVSAAGIRCIIIMSFLILDSNSVFLASDSPVMPPYLCRRLSVDDMTSFAISICELATSVQYGSS